MKNKREYDCSVNLLGKPPIREEAIFVQDVQKVKNIFLSLLENLQEFFTYWKWNSKPVFNLGTESQLLLSNLILCERDWIRQLPVKEQAGFENARGIFQLYIPVGDKRLWTFKLSILRHYIADYIICGLVTASHLERPEARLKLCMHQGQSKEIFAPVLQSSKLTEFKAMLTSYLLKTTLLILGRGKHSNTEILRGHWLSWHRQKKEDEASWYPSCCSLYFKQIREFFCWVKRRKLSLAIFCAVWQIFYI